MRDAGCHYWSQSQVVELALYKCTILRAGQYSKAGLSKGLWNRVGPKLECDVGIGAGLVERASGNVTYYLVSASNSFTIFLSIHHTALLLCPGTCVH